MSKAERSGVEPEVDEPVQEAQEAASALGDAIGHATTPEERAAAVSAAAEALGSSGVKIFDPQSTPERVGRTGKTRTEVLIERNISPRVLLILKKQADQKKADKEAESSE